MNTLMLDTDMPVPGPFCTDDITRGVCRYLRNLGYSPLTEFKLISKIVVRQKDQNVKSEKELAKIHEYGFFVLL